MFVRRWVSDVALAVLIAFPAVLPASQSMRTAAFHAAPPAPAGELAYLPGHELRGRS